MFFIYVYKNIRILKKQIYVIENCILYLQILSCIIVIYASMLLLIFNFNERRKNSKQHFIKYIQD